MLSVNKHILLEIAKRAKEYRLRERLTQDGLAKRSGVSLGSIKRFEAKGLISLENLIKIASVIGNLDDFKFLFKEQKKYKSIDEALKAEKKYKRGIIK